MAQEYINNGTFQEIYNFGGGTTTVPAGETWHAFLEMYQSAGQNVSLDGSTVYAVEDVEGALTGNFTIEMFLDSGQSISYDYAHIISGTVLNDSNGTDIDNDVFTDKMPVGGSTSVPSGGVWKCYAYVGGVNGSKLDIDGATVVNFDDFPSIGNRKVGPLFLNGGQTLSTERRNGLITGMRVK